MKTHAIKLTDEDLSIIAQALGEIPYRVAAPVLNSISQQVHGDPEMEIVGLQKEPEA